MSPSRARYVTACQQLLALGVVVMALVPATRVVSLDVVGVGPGQGVAQPTISVSPDPGESAEAGMSGYARVQHQQRCSSRSLRVGERSSTTAVTGRQCVARGQHRARTRPVGAG
jgi:hypothetical protein